MKQPAFTLWPWKALALTVPVMAFVAALFSTEHSRNAKDVLTVFFGVLAAGNAYVFAMAVGDFGRSVVAIPAGALAGFLAVRIFAYPIVNLVFLLFIIIYALLHILRGAQSAPLGCIVSSVVFIGFSMVARTAGTGGEEAWLCVWFSYPFTCACVTATMPLENTCDGVWRAAIAGLSAALYGMLMGVVALVAGGVLWAVFANAIAGRRTGPDSAIVPGILGVLAANYFCVKHIFSGIHRVEIEKDKSKVKSEK
jgi:hypothetical protein